MKLIPFLLLLFSLGGAFAQNANTISDVKFQHESRVDELKMPFSTFRTDQQIQSGQSYVFELSPNHLFSCFGVGFTSSNNGVDPGLFQVSYRTKHTGQRWSEWMVSEAEVHPDNTPTEKYWTEALFTSDASSQSSIQIRITVPVAVSEIQVDMFDGNFKGGNELSDDTKNQSNSQKNEVSSRANCPEFPQIITRDQWCGGSAACAQVNSWYNPTYINIGHIVIHHGASPNTYTDGQAVVRSYYNYHVNTLGWADIGYNYLIDKYGNFYQGRHNPNLPTSDVRAAHAGAANSSSIGVNFLGNLDVSIATTAQLNKLYDLLAWWFDYKALNPLGSANMQTQAYGVQYMERITCHRDINPTGCPGNDMYSRMANIRQEVQNVIDACNNVVADQIAPTTQVSSTYKWRGHDFWADFDDTDNPGGSGVETQYYQVLDFDGTEWRANSDNGFFNDNFDTAIHPDWTAQDGSWSINNSTIHQSDEAVGNSNIYARFSQVANNQYLYQWSANMDGSGTNRRSGLHFFVDDPALPNRGNSYLAYFRADDNEVHLYKVENDVLNLVVNVPYTINSNTWYDFKVTFDPTSGEFEAFIDNDRVATYTDPSPHTSGSYISLRNGDSQVYYDNFKVRKDRDFQEKITVGPQTTNDSRYESPTNTEDACRINSIVKDVADNWSTQDAKQFYIDWTLPTTAGSTANTWQTQGFTTTFNDQDNVNGSQIQKSFYQVIDYNGTNWYANSGNGFYSDNFDQGAIHPNWNIVNGSWNVSNNHLEQTDESESNTNIYAFLKQDLSNRYLYNFQMKLSGSGNNKRGGFHYFSDDPTAANRGNSYFVWFRQELQSLEFYSVSNDTFTQEKAIPIDFTENVWMDVKIIYDRTTGETFVYKDDKLIGDWKHTTPLTTGNYISFRSGNSNMSINNLKVYRSRFPSVQVSLGTPSSDIRYQNPDPSTISAKVKSIVQDTAQNLSTVDYLELNIDWTPPTGLADIYDGLGSDIDTFYTSNQIEGNWNSAIDVNSEISYYEISIGTSPGDSNSVAWTNVGNVTSHSLTGLNLSGGTTYYVNIRAINNAGLTSNLISSDGQYLDTDASIEENDMLPFSVYPNPFNSNIQIDFNQNIKDVSLVLFNVNGQKIRNQELEQANKLSYNLEVSSSLANGMYILEVRSKTDVWKVKLIKK
jgi:hypothetical protein